MLSLDAMATLLIATPFVHSNALRSRAMVAGFEGQRTSRVAWRAASVSAAGEEHRVDARDEVTVLQSLSSPLLNLSPADLIAAFFEEEVHEESQQAHVPQQLEPVAEAIKPVRRRSERVIFTEEKARRLRKENRATQTFHDKWYHSAIASKLATPE